MSDAQPSLLGYDAYLTAGGGTHGLKQEQFIRRQFILAEGRETEAEVAARLASVEAMGERPPPRLRVWSDGRLVKLKVPAQKGGRVGGKRGLAGCSRASRKRAIEKLHTIPRTCALPQFYTLTFPDLFPDIKQAKRFLDSFFKRVKRAFPTVSAMWRMELIARKSGESLGQVAPHFHLLVFGNVPIEFAKQAWFESCRSSDYAHLRHGAHDAGELEKWEGAVFYCAKDMVKPCAFSATGRIWGIHNRASFPAVKQPSASVVVTARQVVKLQRVMRKLDRVRNLRSAAALERRAAFPGEKRAGHLLRRARAALWRARDGTSSRTVFFAKPGEWLRLLETCLQ